ncbi:MAG: paraquat-inducible protein A [Oceanicoccus sp.]
MENHTVQTFRQTISDREIKVLVTVYTITCLLFVIGLFLPMLTLSKFFVVKNTVSVASSIFELAASGNWLLFVVIFGFSVAMPVLKLRLIYVLIAAQGRIDKATKKWLNWVHEYGRWGMLDVFVVAVLLVSVKLGAIATVKIHVGLYFFGAAVLLMMLLTHRLSAAYETIERG